MESPLLKSKLTNSSKSTMLQSLAGDLNIASDSDTEVDDITVALRATTPNSANRSSSRIYTDDRVESITDLNWNSIEQNLYKTLYKFSEDDRKAVIDQFRWIEHRVDAVVNDFKAKLAAKDEETKQVFLLQREKSFDKKGAEDHIKIIKHQLAHAVGTVEALTKLCAKTDRNVEGVIEFVLKKVSLPDDLILDMQAFTSMHELDLPLSIQTTTKVHELLYVIWPYVKTRLLLRRKEASEIGFFKKFTHPLL